MKDSLFLTQTELFSGTSQQEAEAMLACLGVREKTCQKGSVILSAGETTDSMGLVLSGCVHIVTADLWGNQTILGYAGAGELFAESYACVPGEPMMVSAVAAEDSEILFLNAGRLLKTCTDACLCHTRVIRNLLQISAQKNLALSRRSLHTAPKTIRGRVRSFLSEQAKKNGRLTFRIPYNRQQLADYLGVDRSALSGELSRMQNEGEIRFRKNVFTVFRGEDET